MSEGYVKRLLKPSDTLNVLREMPIWSGDLLRGRLKAAHRTGAGGVAQAYHHVEANDRVSYFDLRVESNPNRFLKLVIENQQVSTQFQSGKSAKKLRPCFYLPFKMKGTTRMKLAPPAGYTGDEIKFFGTATIDGCSVYVEGPQTSPKVSHNNASDVAPYPNRPETDAEKQQRVTAKIQAMDARMAVIKKGPSTVVERPNYMEDYAPGRSAAMLQFANSRNIPIGQVISYEPFGAIIGISSGGNWTFYVQKSGTFTYKMTPTGKDMSAYFVLSANEFWPTNTGGFRIF